ncbi:hypothetical protein QYF61_026401 [Mycteria americana]|uniref:glucuronosyltransferase n=1 Tax=Mycteria americana TaxID=33587 RepID=A0AAN7S307_MYCAM|nr:hypothetical protein QYF61_026401 [Mycteria americana]
MAPVLSAHPQVTAVLALLLSVLSLAAGGKLLVVQVDGSPWLSMREVLDGLRQRGHEIVVVAPEINLHIKPTKDFVMKMYPVPFTQEELDENFQAFLQDVLEEGSFLEKFLKVYQSTKRVSDLAVSSCEHLLYNKELVRYLEDSKFDAVLTDPVLPCGQILAEHLSVPSVFFLRGIPCGLEFEATQCPNPPSYVPRILTEHTDRMNFLQRVKNLIFDIPNYFLCDFIFQSYAKLASGFLQRDVTVLDLLRQASIWLMRSDFVLDYPRPLMPNIILIGGVNCAHKKLPQISAEMALMLTAHPQVMAMLALLLSVLSLAAGGKLLVVPVDGSRWLSMREVLDGLRQKGHEILQIPCGLEFEATQCPNPPSYVPRILTEHTDRMNFLQWVKNLIFDIPNYFLCEFLFQPYTKLASEFLQQDVTVPDLLRKASIWLLRLDFVFHYPRPLMPKMIVIGGVNCAHKKLTQISAEMALVLSAHPQVTAVLALLLSVLSLAAGGKLLVVPVDESCWLSMREVLDGLRQKGHEIVVVAPERNLHIKPTKDFVMKMYSVPFTQEELDHTFWRTSQDVSEEGSFLERIVKTYEAVKNASAMFLSTCEHLLYNKELVRYLEDSKFDAVLTDPVLPCGQILAEHLSVPSVFLLQQIPCGLEFEATQCPNPPSYVPRILTEHTDHMNFLQRVKNLIFDIPSYFPCDFVFQPYAKLASGFLQRDVTVLDLLRQASIWP